MEAMSNQQKSMTLTSLEIPITKKKTKKNNKKKERKQNLFIHTIKLL